MTDPAVLSVSNVLMPDGAVQTTSQLTFSNVADLANGQALQNFMRGHLALHMETVQQQGALPRPSLRADHHSRPIDNSFAMPGPSRHRPRRPAPRFRLRSAPPQRRSDEDDDETWQSMTSASNQTGTWCTCRQRCADARPDTDYDTTLAVSALLCPTIQAQHPRDCRAH